MPIQECSFQNLALSFQLAILLLSLSFSVATIIPILRQKLYRNPFTFLILVIQCCYLAMALIDLLTKTTVFSDAYIIWCKVMSPFIYGAILSSFILMQIFVLMIYITISKKGYGWINHNVKLIALSIVTAAVCMNCVGIPFYSLGFCESCGFHAIGKSHYQQFVNFIIGVDYYLPMILIIPCVYLFYKLMKEKQKHEFNAEQSLAFKVLWIPFLNFIVLSLSSISNYLPQMAAVGYVFIFDSIYYVSILNFIFYSIFVNFFEFGSPRQEKLCCKCDCLKSSNQSSFQSELYPYLTRHNS